MKAKDKAWQLYSTYFDIIENGQQEGNLVEVHIKAVNAALFAVNEALMHAPDDIVNDFEGTGEYYSVKAYYYHVKNEILKLNTPKKNESNTNI
jgi:hypothetical protein